MFQISATARITAGLVCLITSLLFVAQTLGLVPNETSVRVAARTRLCETIAIDHSVLANRGDTEGIAAAMEAIVARNEELHSAAVRLANGDLLAASGPHRTMWRPESMDGSTDTHVFVPLFREGRRWATVELRFEPLVRDGWLGWLTQPFTKLALFLTVSSFVVLFYYLRRILVQLDPSRVVPDRVRRAFDTLAEGVVILDDRERIVLANSVFAAAVGIESARLQGRSLSSVEGFESTGEVSAAWMPAVQTGRSCTGTPLSLRGPDGDLRRFQVNASPIMGEKGASRGALVSFDDVTPLENKRQELKKLVDLLRESGEEIRRQNAELEILATRDPLTNCLNRRSFFTKFEENWGLAVARERPISCVMVDVDHFKSINDNHGHAAGDEVLSAVGRILNEQSREDDVVCRYGGEEFCILFPETDVEGAVGLAENVRLALEAEEIGELRITASLGVSGVELGAESPEEMLDQADRCLYVAKRNGRNQVVSFADVPEDEAVQEEVRETVADPSTEPVVAIPFHAVTALFSALSYRDHVTAEHSRRVADLCVAVGRRVLGRRGCYTLEIAALLHDIGKIGVPDAILLKPGPLTAEEWEVMHEHDHYGVEIVRAAFQSPELSSIIESHHAFYGGTEHKPDSPVGSDIPLGARLLAIADAYDAMVSDRVYRAARPREEAFEELRRCAGSQFDARLVELFIDTIERLPTERPESANAVTKELALSIGLQIERLVEAIEEADIDLLESLAVRLHATAARNGLQNLAAKADDLHRSIAESADPSRLVTMAGDLLDICRSTQSAFLVKVGPSSSMVTPAVATTDV